MTDICKCTGEGCHIKEQCYRYTAKADELRQSYMYPVGDGDKDCEYFWDNNVDAVNISEECVEEKGENVNMNNTNKELKPCPFCSTNYTALDICLDCDEYWYVACDNCDGKGGYANTEEDAILKWNHRYTPKLSMEKTPDFHREYDLEIENKKFRKAINNFLEKYDDKNGKAYFEGFMEVMNDN
jgi:hypothetical protein